MENKNFNLMALLAIMLLALVTFIYRWYLFMCILSILGLVLHLVLKKKYDKAKEVDANE